MCRFRPQLKFAVLTCRWTCKVLPLLTSRHVCFSWQIYTNPPFKINDTLQNKREWPLVNLHSSLLAEHGNTLLHDKAPSCTALLHHESRLCLYFTDLLGSGWASIKNMTVGGCGWTSCIGSSIKSPNSTEATFFSWLICQQTACGKHIFRSRNCTRHVLDHYSQRRFLLSLLLR